MLTGGPADRRWPCAQAQHEPEYIVPLFVATNCCGVPPNRCAACWGILLEK